MPKPKTVPSCSKPQVHNGWIRKSDLDAWLDRHLPVPTQVISNEEYLPIPQTPRQRLLEQEIVANAERQAGYLGMDRRRIASRSRVPHGRWNMVNVLWKACVGEEAQDIAEYAGMLAVILVIVVGTIRLVGSNANNVFSSVASSVQ